MKNKTPKNLEKAFETAIDITFPIGSNPERKNKIKEALSNAVYDIYDIKTKESYTNKVHLIVQNAKKEYNLDIKDEEEKQLINNLLKLRDTISLDSYIGCLLYTSHFIIAFVVYHFLCFFNSVDCFFPSVIKFNCFFH